MFNLGNVSKLTINLQFRETLKKELEKPSVKIFYRKYDLLLFYSYQNLLCSIITIKWHYKMAPSPWVTKVCNKMKKEKWGSLMKKVTGQNTRKYDMEINGQAKSLFFTKMNTL